LPPAVVRLTDLNYLLVEYISNNIFLSFSSATPLFTLRSNHSNASQGLCTTGFGSVLAFRSLCGLGCHYAGTCPKLWPPNLGPSCGHSTQHSGQSAKNNMKHFSRNRPGIRVKMCNECYRALCSNSQFFSVPLWPPIIYASSYSA
jgi:hypothetical protein